MFNSLMPEIYKLSFLTNRFRSTYSVTLGAPTNCTLQCACSK